MFGDWEIGDSQGLRLGIGAKNRPQIGDWIPLPGRGFWNPPPEIGDWEISRAEIGRLGTFEIGITEAGTYM